MSDFCLLRYWDHSIVPLPAVDIRSAYDKGQGVSISYTRRLLVTTLYHTWSYTGFALVLLIVAIYCIAGMNFTNYTKNLVFNYD